MFAILAQSGEWTAPLYTAGGLALVAIIAGAFGIKGKKIEAQRTDPENVSLEVATMRDVIETVNQERQIEREDRKLLAVEATSLRAEVGQLHNELSKTFEDARLAMSILRKEVHRLRELLNDHGIDPGPEVVLPSLPSSLTTP